MPRTRRAYQGHQEMASASAACHRLGPSRATITIASSSGGNARNMSATRMTASSSQPPR